MSDTTTAMRQVQSLLERAGHAATEEHGRDACIKAADRLMAKHRLDRAMLNFAKTETIREIISREYDEMKLEEYGYQVNEMRREIFTHTGAKMSTTYWRKSTAVGYEDDLFYAELLWANVYMDIIIKMFPKWEPWRSYEENVHAIKSAGYSWPQTRDMVLPHEPKGLTYQNAGGHLRAAFKRWALKINEPVLPGKQQPINPKHWRDSFIQSYASTLRRRLMMMNADNAKAGEGNELALIKDSDRVRAEFYRLFPDLDPERSRAKEEARRAALTDEERAREDAEREKWLNKKPRKEKVRYANPNAWVAGHKAATNVKLSADKHVGNGRAGEIGG